MRSERDARWPLGFRTESAIAPLTKNHQTIGRAQRLLLSLAAVIFRQRQGFMSLAIITSSRGNALFLILIAVALFAALSYAVTQSGRGGGTIGKEQTVIAAAQIVQIGGSLQQAINRMTLTGTPADNIVFSTAECAAPNSGNECTTGTNCLFAREGGGVLIPDLPANIGGTIQICYSTAAEGWSVQDVGTASADVQFSIDGLSTEVCSEINRGLGISGIPVDLDGNAVANAAPGEWAFCYEWGGGAYDRSYVQVLFAH